MPAYLIKPKNLMVARKFACSRGHALTNLYIRAVEAPALITFSSRVPRCSKSIRSTQLWNLVETPLTSFLFVEETSAKLYYLSGSRSQLCGTLQMLAQHA